METWKKVLGMVWKAKNYRGAHRQDHVAAIKTNPTVLKPDIALKKLSGKSMQTH